MGVKIRADKGYKILPSIQLSEADSANDWRLPDSEGSTLSLGDNSVTAISTIDGTRPM